jgi:hypothetical protein
MKAGITTQVLAERVNATINSRKDYITGANALRFLHDEEQNTLKAEIQGHGEYAMTDLFGTQVGQHLSIPAAYYKRLGVEDKHLLAYNVNRLNSKDTSTRLVRTLDNGHRIARAYLSNAYRPLDNEQVLQQVLPALGMIEGLEFMDCELTENRMYLKAVTPRIAGEIKKGDVVQAGVMISNSEVGGGALNISLLVFRLVCLNGMILPDGKFRAMHLGKRVQAGDEAYELLTDETKRADDKVLLMKARDVAQGIFTQENFDKILGRMRASTEQQMKTKRPDRAVEVLAKSVGFNGEEQISVLQHLLQGGDLSRWGFANAVTRMAQDVPGYDRSVQLEALGARVMELPASEWKAMENAD